MRKTTSTGLCAAIVTVAAAVATAQAPTPQNNSSTADAKDAKTVVTGCLREAPSGATDAGAAGPRAGGPPPAGQSSAPAGAASKFVLENATASGASADASSKSGPQTYQLNANPSGLAPHVGKKLELTGTLEPSSGAGPTLKVESGKIVAASCS